MISDLFFYQLLLVGLLWLCLMLHGMWPSERVMPGSTRPPPPLPPRKRSSDPQPFPGLTRKPPCGACEQAHEHVPQPPGCPPPRIVPTRGRRRQVDPNTVLEWLVEVADHAAAFSQYFLHDVRVTQVQLDELFALLSAVKAGEVSEAAAITRLSRAPHWVWAALDPVTKLLLTVEVGDRTLAMAQRMVHQVVQVLAPGCVPLFLTDGFKEYTTALLTHYGQWVQPPRRQDKGPAPQPRWMPLPGLLYAQVIKTVRRRRLVRVTHRVVFGTLEAIQQVLAACGWQ